MSQALYFFAWILFGPTCLAQEEFVPGTHVPPAVGAVAPPLETVYWYYEGPEGRVPALEELRGDVVLVHTWGYYCGPCMKEGVPYVVDLVKANAERGLRALSITVPVGDGKPDDHFVKVGRELGLNHPLGTADGFGGMTPYVNMNKSKGLTWCFVIGRDGGVRWSGDPSIDDEEFLESVRAALAAEPAPPLGEDPPEPLAKAIAFYVDGNFTKARAATEKAARKFAKKKASAEVTAVNAYAKKLLEDIDGHRMELMTRLDEALAARNAEAFVAARLTLLARYPKTDAAKHVKALEKEVKEDGAFAASVEAWAAWDELRRGRPALFPVRDDKTCARYAKELAKYVEGAPEDRPGLARARELHAAYAAAGSR